MTKKQPWPKEERVNKYLQDYAKVEETLRGCNMFVHTVPYDSITGQIFCMSPILRY